MGILSNIFNRDWTLSDLMNADYKRQQKSSGCQAVLEETYTELKKEGILDKFKKFFTRNKAIMNTMYVIFKFTVYSETGHSYTVIIRTQYDPKSILYMRNKAQIACSCPDFKFKSAWVLNQHQSLFRSDRTELELGPAITNAPKKKKGFTLCKHSFAAVMYLVNNYSYLMGNV